MDSPDAFGGPGDDGAVVTIESGGAVVVCGEALYPPFVAADPFAAGISAVLANVNDLAAMGAVPRGIVNTVVASREMAAQALNGMAAAAKIYAIDVVGGHISEHDGEPALSAFAIGEVDAVLSATNARPDQQLVFACFLDGEMRADFDFFSTLRGQAARLANDIGLLAKVARRGLAVAAKDVSMAGSIGSLAMLLEPNRLGAEVDLDALPVPHGVGMKQWLTCFPSYAFWLCGDHGHECVELFRSAGVAAARVGKITGSGQVNLSSAGATRTVFDLQRESITGLWS